MILKSFQIEKINFKDNKLILFYGKNNGFKNQIIESLSKKFDKTLKYEEKEIIDNLDSIISNLYTNSLFGESKLIIIQRATDKLFKFLELVENRKIGETTIVINSENLEKKSKIRNFFEKSKENVSIAFYPDDQKTMAKIAYNFLNKNKVSISQSNLNLIIGKCREDRELLIKELEKLIVFSKGKKEIGINVIEKLTNVVENHDISTLIDNCLMKNHKKVIHILNENNFSNEDCVQITRTFLIKAKKIKTLSEEFKKNMNLELTINNSKPPIFWKEKEIVKSQIYKWEVKAIKKLIYELNNIELKIKKNFDSSINLITDFMLTQAK